MKEDKKNKTTDLFESFLPDRVKDDPNENLKKEKKLYTIIFITICTLVLVSNLIAMIINFCFSVQMGVTSLFVGFINCIVAIFSLGLLIVMAHNLSKITRATLFMCSKLMKDEKRYVEEQKKLEEQQAESDKAAEVDAAAEVEDSKEVAADIVEDGGIEGNVADNASVADDKTNDNVAVAEVVVE